MTPANSMKKLC